MKDDNEPAVYSTADPMHVRGTAVHDLLCPFERFGSQALLSKLCKDHYNIRCHEERALGVVAHLFIKTLGSELN